MGWVGDIVGGKGGGPAGRRAKSIDEVTEEPKAVKPKEKSKQKGSKFYAEDGQGVERAFDTKSEADSFADEVEEYKKKRGTTTSKKGGFGIHITVGS